MSDMENREGLLRQDGYFIGIATLSLVNGMNSSPYFEQAAILLRPIFFGFSITSTVIIFYLTSLILSVGSVVLAGVPAALFERATGRQTSDGTSLSIWFGSIFLLAIPSIAGLLGGG
jgi:hypothetical protein